MALLEADALASIKVRLSIVDSGFDALLETMIADNVKRLFPRLQVETDTFDITASFNNQLCILDLAALATPLSGVRRVDIVTTNNEQFPVDSIYQQALKLHVRSSYGSANKLRIFGLVRPTLANLDDEYHMGLYYYVMSDWYGSMAGKKSQYNTYQENGAPATDEMADLSKYWEDKATAYINERAPLYGHQ